MWHKVTNDDKEQRKFMQGDEKGYKMAMDYKQWQRVTKDDNEWLGMSRVTMDGKGLRRMRNSEEGWQKQQRATEVINGDEGW